MIRALSLFSGIGAFEKALERQGIEHEVVAYCEIDKYASKSYSAIHNVPESMNLGDITKVDPNAIPDFDLMTWGFPCQDISVAGNLKGIVEGETRSGLYYEGFRILKAKMPKYSIIENVKNLVGKRFKADFVQMLSDIEELGYNNYWQVLNAKDYGIPQNRERVFIVSIRKDVDKGNFIFPEKEPLELRLKDMLEGEVDEKYYLSKAVVNKLPLSHIKETGFVGYKVKGKETDVAMTLLVEMAVVEPYIVASRGRYVDDRKTEQQYEPNKDGITNTLTSVQKDNMLVEPKCIQAGTLSGGKWDKQYEQSRRFYSTDGISPTVHTYGGGGQETKIVEPTACERRMDEGLRFFKDGCVGSTRTIDSCGDKRVIYPDYRIRKLTPTECWRLMGFDDVDIEKAKDIGISNSQLYKQAGNSVVVNVLEKILQNLLKQRLVGND